ncbi:glycosyltransferase family 2 protein [Bacterioplanoides sp. SCSIO 12839]|uniref:glycosyltransferase family 2 protein n=1 Tax=Bacterioplanoides sp. SCSIO 12839 TaxID=2829569 RepID=UPI0021022A6F|nr:glycosyltransferase family 2 protein [Bacterioplanoides sp. SCSIO 12839]UTW47832.1 glycosyltransferase family 2 protein [Bacterioplanoides sp. SCSIO 12839]
MRVHAYFVCFNEEVILPAILDYYSGFCSKIFIYDNGSTDRSIEIAESYPCVRVIGFDTGGKKDNKKHIQIKTEEYKKYSREGGRFCEEPADWVICADMDEVIYAPNLIDVLKKYDEMGVTVPCVTGFNMVGSDDVKPDVNIFEQYRKGVRSETFDKRAIFKPEFDMSYTRGCHSYGAGFELMKDTFGYVSSNAYPIALLHYKHIGGLLYDSAVKNASRFDESDVKKGKNGKYTGPGSHYFLFQDLGPGVNPLLARAKPVLDENNNVLFECFPESVGDGGEKVGVGNKVEDFEVDALRDAAISLEKVNLDLSIALMKIAHRVRPWGVVIKNKLERYKSELGVD